jgi:MSHA pilin protein MshC
VFRDQDMHLYLLHTHEDPRRGSRGFTLVELVTSLVLVGILAAFAAPRLINNQPFEERGYVDELASTLRYAQRIATATQCDVSVALTPTTYDVFERAVLLANGSCTGAFTLAVKRTDGSVVSGIAPGSVTGSATTSIVFDSNGRVSGAAPPPINVGVFSLAIDPTNGTVTETP